MRLKSITIEGMHKVLKQTYLFDNLTYIHGRNGVGKSTILQAIQLALLGYIPGTAKNNTAIFSHSNGSILSVSAQLDDNGSNVVITRTWAKLGKTIKSDMEVIPEGFDVDSVVSKLELPIYNFAELMGMTANKQKDWWISFLPPAKLKIDWEKVLTDAVGDEAEAGNEELAVMIKELAQTEGVGVDQIRNINAKVKSNLSFFKSESTRIANTISMLTHYDVVDDTVSDDVSVLQAEIQDYQKMALEIEAHNYAVDSNKYASDAMKKALKDIGGSAEAAEAEYARLKSLADEQLALAEEADRNDHELQRIMLEAKAKYSNLKQMITSTTMCPFLKEECDTLKDNIAAIKPQAEEAEKAYNSASKAYDEAILKSGSYRCKHKSASTEAAELAEKINKYNYLKSREVPVNDISKLPCQSVAECEAEIAKRTSKIAAVQANQKYNEMYDLLTVQKFAADQTMSVLKKWDTLTGVNGLQTSAMLAPFTEFASSMDKYIKVFFDQNTSAKFNLSEKANDFSFGIMRGDAYIPFELLSSGEKCMYTLAMETCVADQSDAPLKAVLVDDMFDHLDDENINQVMDAISSIGSVQYVFAGVKPVKFVKGKGKVMKIQ